MYASLVAAGVSKLYDLVQSATSSSPRPSDSSFSVSSSSGSGATSTANPSTSALSTDVNKLFLDLQASQSSASAGSASSVAGDLQSVSGDLKAAGGPGHHHHVAAFGTQGLASTDPSTGRSANPFQNLAAASLTAYSNSQGLTAGAGSGTSLTA